jgi:hypothetical protein
VFNLFEDNNTIGLRTFFEALSIFNHDPAALKEFLESIGNQNATVLDFDFSKMDDFEKKKALLHSIDSLCLGDWVVTKIRAFSLCCTSTVLINLMLNHTKLGSILNEEQKDMFREFVFKFSVLCVTNNYGLYRTFEANGALEYESIGKAVFPFASLFNHSCAPNVSRINVGLKMFFLVKRPIKAGEQLFDSYG